MLSPKDSCREGREGSHCGLESRDSAWKRIHETREAKEVQFSTSGSTGVVGSVREISKLQLECG